MGSFIITNRLRHVVGPNTLGHEKFTLKEHDDLQVKYAQLARKLEVLELKKVNELIT